VINGLKISNLLFADDIAAIAKTETFNSLIVDRVGQKSNKIMETLGL